MEYGKSFYDRFMHPLERNGLADARQSLIPKAYGTVLEIGPGSGVNLRYYPFSQIESLCLFDRRIQPVLKSYPYPEATMIAFAAGTAESLPFPDASFDTVVACLVFCTVPNAEKGLSEIWRVLKPGGAYLFIEHILSDQPVLGPAMQAATPLWKLLANGCHLNRQTDQLIESLDFSVQEKNYFMKHSFVSGIAVKPMD